MFAPGNSARAQRQVIPGDHFGLVITSGRSVSKGRDQASDAPPPPPARSAAVARARRPYKIGPTGTSGTNLIFAPASSIVHKAVSVPKQYKHYARDPDDKIEPFSAAASKDTTSKGSSVTTQPMSSQRSKTTSVRQPKAVTQTLYQQQQEASLLHGNKLGANYAGKNQPIVYIKSKPPSTTNSRTTTPKRGASTSTRSERTASTSVSPRAVATKLSQRTPSSKGRGVVAATTTPADQNRSQLKGSAFPREITAAEVLSSHKSDLTPFEQSEIQRFAKIYYWGQQANKQYNGAINHGYDDSRGDYIGVINDHIMYRYELVSKLGSGSFGKVYKALDHKEQQFVALKIIKNRKRFQRQGLVEVKILELLRDNDPNGDQCCVKVLSSFYFRSHLCIAFELLSINLYELLTKKDLKGLSLSLVRKFSLQLLIAFAYARKLRIIHADVKPENILLREPDKSSIKVIDWGSGAMVSETIYSYIQSRFYRAPEVILGLPYGQEIDIWSIGCVLCELYTGLPIFPGDDERDQLGKICELLGMPPNDMIFKSPRKNDFFVNIGTGMGVAGVSEGGNPIFSGNLQQLSSVNEYLQATGRGAGGSEVPGIRLRTTHKVNSKTLSGVLNAPDDFISFISLFLQWDPQRRCTPEVAMSHPWIQEGIRQINERNARPSSTAVRAVDARPDSRRVASASQRPLLPALSPKK
ncbi:Kinase, CMGC DYRK [Giardia duodenalis]|uniref:dual-specificity kinase n=1 Tax=Giardia intestinalis (strain ATCC 50803 / WB clone C6) TaxID=184922 RepID=A8BDE8_GIAIC|nr:Kinase, CMGC DYRK [Giardia intestinalis]KAE8304227.1 Kinase, CMGC DYRK [Giardia intestinalis]|eukprot:XP_001707775.1 Kinase, CMGC DYRK [Giardia lamblia ATCC 50803]